jgi:hypothetical protein
MVQLLLISRLAGKLAQLRVRSLTVQESIIFFLVLVFGFTIQAIKLYNTSQFY